MKPKQKDLPNGLKEVEEYFLEEKIVEEEPVVKVSKFDEISVIEEKSLTF